MALNFCRVIESCRKRNCASSSSGTPAAEKLRAIKSFRKWCLVVLRVPSCKQSCGGLEHQPLNHNNIRVSSTSAMFKSEMVCKLSTAGLDARLEATAPLTNGCTNDGVIHWSTACLVSVLSDPNQQCMFDAPSTGVLPICCNRLDYKFRGHSCGTMNSPAT